MLPKLGQPGPAFLKDVPGAPEAGTPLCRIDEIPENGAKVFSFGSEEDPFEFFVQRIGEAVYAYRNLCPHVALPLDWRPAVFMDPQRKFFLCANHGAVFRPEDGYCFAGPCRGQHLTAIAIDVKDGVVTVAGETGQKALKRSPPP